MQIQSSCTCAKGSCQFYFLTVPNRFVCYSSPLLGLSLFVSRFCFRQTAVLRCHFFGRLFTRAVSQLIRGFTLVKLILLTRCSLFCFVIFCFYFHPSTTSLSPLPVFFLLPIPRRFLGCRSSLFLRQLLWTCHFRVDCLHVAHVIFID